MRVMVLVKATAESERGDMPSTEMFEAMGSYNEELVKAGIMQAGEGLHPTSRAHRVRFDGATRTVLDGPFSPSGEQVAGYWIWQVKDMDEALAWLKRCPNPMPGPSEIEIRRIYEMEDFGEAWTPELAEREKRLQAEIAAKG
ncbi:YciI family protein [Roseococcus sp. YIM B11640]|uniref:YciI family protein n=1 Tax=Roseococcus sp. YIM B11640 TaxID=3133973 RepID=UPI003C79F071